MQRTRCVATAILLALTAACSSGDDADRASGTAARDTTTSTSTTAPSAPTTAAADPGAPPGGGPVDPTAPVDLDDCARQLAAARRAALTTDLEGAGRIVAEWQESGCEAACGDIAVANTNERCRP